MKGYDKIESFLNQVKSKAKVFDIAFRSRDKNISNLGQLGIMPSQRQDIILELSANNYISGPNKDNFNPILPDFYEFGTTINGKEVYIKLNKGLTDKMVDCMSFHLAEKPMIFPFK